MNTATLSTSKTKKIKQLKANIKNYRRWIRDQAGTGGRNHGDFGDEGKETEDLGEVFFRKQVLQDMIQAAELQLKQIMLDDEIKCRKCGRTIPMERALAAREPDLCIECQKLAEKAQRKPLAKRSVAWDQSSLLAACSA